MNLEPNILTKVNSWLDGDYDDTTKQTIRELVAQEKTSELTDAFYRDLEFGTGGLRGIMGVGSNRINKYTIGSATQGLSNYLKQQFPDEQIKVAIAHDNRNNAEFFAQTAADIFSANGIHVYFFEGLRPTPELSFAIRELGCQSGIMLTASHNPKEYSGYKVYWSDGGQVVNPHDKGIIAEVNNIQSVADIKFEGKPERIESIGEKIDKRFIENVLAASINPEVVKQEQDLKIVYSPIHGAGVEMVPRALKELGFTNVNLVEEQLVTSGDFPTVVYPNPEEKEALTLALKLAGKIDADLVMATDPDADRVGIAVKNNAGEHVLLNGNQTGTLIFNYLIEQWKQKGKLTGNEYIAKTIVTTNIIDEIAKANDVTCYNLLTGFKYIGALMTELEGKATYIAGAEESYGYLIGAHVRDKDAVVACTIIAEMAAYYKHNGKTLFQTLQEIYVKYGFYKEELISLTKGGKQGAEEISQLMQGYRNNPPQELGGKKIVRVNDYQTSKSYTFDGGGETAIDLPKSNVMQFLTEEGYVITARPSGTEPKIKYYISVNTELDSVSDFAAKDAELEALIDDLSKSLLASND
ncbi:phosphoglucomutase [Neolewinella xylanilytica]|uniref:Phosphoglucomutase n=1 Tax=Neolewinella xylanilytica TaxID=1514080 RepID=A0A2S6I6K1_9BACT|nr:phospho-sugar mutase [Neolewinella xylanilytica]PPK87099.1 phosphoglucomutase [Neolewinella xylanilytica]